MVILDMFGSWVGAPQMDSMLYPRPENSPVIRDVTLGLFSTSMVKIYDCSSICSPCVWSIFTELKTNLKQKSHLRKYLAESVFSGACQKLSSSCLPEDEAGVYFFLRGIIILICQGERIVYLLIVGPVET